MRLRGAHFLLIAALGGSAALLISYVSRLSFIGDEWQLLIGRRGWGPDTFLAPFNENLIAGIAAVYKIGLAVFGMGSALPFYAVSIALFLLCAVLLFVYLERRVGEWAAAVGAVLVLFLGTAHEDLFWAFQMGFFGSIAAGVGALIALDREDRLGDRLACGLLLASLAFGSVGLAFVAAGIADLALGRRPRRRRAYVALAPLAAYLAWWLGWGQSAGSQIGLETVLRTPLYVFEAAAEGVVSLLGREPVGADGHPPVLAQALLVVLILGAGIRLVRRGDLSRGMAVALALALSFWVLIGLDRTAGDRFALSSRYQYPSAVFVLILAAELLRGVRIPRPAAAALVLVSAGAVVGGVSAMDSHFPRWKRGSDGIRLNLSVLEIARPSIDPGLGVSFPPSARSTAGAYFAGVDRFGSPAYDEAELMNRPEADRRSADRMLAEALGIALSRRGAAVRTEGCRTIASGGAALDAGRFTLANSGSEPTRIRLRRFASAPSVGLGRIPAGGERSLAIPEDGADRSWMLMTDRPLRLCRAQAGAATHRVPRDAGLPLRQS